MTSPKKIALTMLGSLGDLHPLLGLARALQHRHYAVTIATSASYQSEVEAAGCRFHPVAPDLNPGRQPVPNPGKGTRAIMEALDSGEIRAVILVGADPVGDMPDPRPARAGLEAAEYVISIDLFMNESNADADVILPAAGFAEKEGTITNLEGRVQKVNRVRPAPGSARPDWSILDDLASQMGFSLGLASAETIAKEISEVLPLYAGVTHDHLEWEARDGVVVPIDGEPGFEYLPVAIDGPKTPGAQLVLHQARTLYDDGVRLRNCPSLHPLAPGPVVHVNPSDAPGLGVKDDSTLVVTTAHGEGRFTAVVDDKVPAGVVYVPLHQAGGAHLGTDPVVRVKVDN